MLAIYAARRRYPARVAAGQLGRLGAIWNATSERFGGCCRQRPDPGVHVMPSKLTLATPWASPWATNQLATNQPRALGTVVPTPAGPASRVKPPVTVPGVAPPGGRSARRRTPAPTSPPAPPAAATATPPPAHTRP